MPYLDPDKNREYQRNWVAARRAAFFSDKHCKHCGSKENLELDHIDPALKDTHRIWSWSASRRDREIAKCQVLCKACHLSKTVASRPIATHCSHGHEYAVLGKYPSGGCVECKLTRQRFYRMRDLQRVEKS